MGRVDDLELLLEDITINDIGMFDLILSLREFFEREDIQTMMVKLNTDRLYDYQTDNNGVRMPAYSVKYKRAKRKQQDYYTYYDTGKTHESLEVTAEAEIVMITPGTDAPEYSNYLMERAWGLTEEQIDTLHDDMADHIGEDLRKYLGV